MDRLHKELSRNFEPGLRQLNLTFLSQKLNRFAKIFFAGGTIYQHPTGKRAAAQNRATLKYSPIRLYSIITQKDDLERYNRFVLPIPIFWRLQKLNPGMVKLQLIVRS